MIKQKIRRFIAVLLSLTIVFGQSSFSVNAQANEDQLMDIENGTTIIKEFLPLEEEVGEQTVPVGTEIEALNLPESLAVSGYIYDDAVTTPSAVMLIIDHVNWISEFDYVSTIPANYVFVPDLSNYVVQTQLPTINIIINDPILEEQLAEVQTTENQNTEVDERINEDIEEVMLFPIPNSEDN